MREFRKNIYRTSQTIEVVAPSSYSYLGTQGTPSCTNGQTTFINASPKTLYASIYSATGDMLEVGILYDDAALTIVTQISGFKKGVYIYDIYEGGVTHKQEQGTTC